MHLDDATARIWHRARDEVLDERPHLTEPQREALGEYDADERLPGMRFRADSLRRNWMPLPDRSRRAVRRSNTRPKLPGADACCPTDYPAERTVWKLGFEGSPSSKKEAEAALGK